MPTKALAETPRILMSQDFAAPSGATAAGVATPVQPSYSMPSRLAAEAFGTFVLVLGIVGTAAFNFLNQGSILTVALAGGVLLMAGVAAVGHVSGGHFNPAVTLGLALGGRASWRDVLPYVAAQLVGAAVSALVLWSLVPESLPAALGMESKAQIMQGTANGYGEHSPLSTAAQGATEFSLWAALLVEVIVTAVLVGVILATGGDKRARTPYPPVLVGLVLAALIILAWPVTNASLNPARSFASALFGGGWTWGQLWLFVVAPLVGGALAALFYRAFSPAPAVAGTVAGTSTADADAPERDLVDDADDDADDDAERYAVTPSRDTADAVVVSKTPRDAATDAEVEAAEAEALAEERRDGEDGGVTPPR
ncbi:MIP/aquaporin family protein [Puerhibacterium sp. TATVAM-FAB25]|uniref:MIP/aquaporin family protein n=1 Tax=Puerhibacterium sp. TATVAM-FAB25 TaxID=3093699 RepID=UPI00397A602B